MEPCSVPQSGDTALIVASKHGNSETIQLLLDAGANKNAVDEVGTEVVKNGGFGGSLGKMGIHGQEGFGVIHERDSFGFIHERDAY